MNVVGAEELELALAQIRAECRDPVAGVFGPDSAVWRVAREQAVLVGGGRASLLQLAHPYVGEAVASSEAAISDPLGRFRRTFEAVYAMVFGHLDDVLAAARRVHRVHTTVRGELPAAGPFPAGHRYEANDRAALRWVLATLVDGSLQALRALGRTFRPGFEEAYWADVRRMGRLFGLRAQDLPESWATFRAWFDATLASELLTVTPRAADVGRRLLAPPGLVTAPLWRAYRALTTELMPEHLREPFGLRLGRRERALSRATLMALRAADRATPARLTHVPAYREAVHRLRVGGRPRDHLGRALEQTVLTVLLRPA